MPYAVASDLHAHNWSSFSTLNQDGVNSRLRIMLDELERAAAGLMLSGGDTLVIAGDIFHSRGNLNPEVLNPVQSAFQRILDSGVSIYMIPGNHDLVGNETTELGSAIQTLSSTFSEAGEIRVYNKPTLVENIKAGDTCFAFVPWHSTTEGMLKAAKKLALDARQKGIIEHTDLFIHAGIDGVLTDMPDHGLSASKLSDLGFRNVFAGHYHHHKDMGKGVYSIGASTHHTWKDVNTKAGFLLVDDAGAVQFQASHAPSFVDVSGMDEDEIALTAKGNYVRFRGDEMSPDDVKELRDFFRKSGSLGESIQVAKKPVQARAGGPTKTGMSLEASVNGFIDGSKDIPAHIDRDEVKRQAAAVLAHVRSTYEEA
jgi:DNA repair exonuclease SbcCD nuclease subunit